MSALHLATEAEVQATVEGLLDLYGWLHWHDVDSRRNRAGLPDILAVRPPVVAFYELKTERGRLRPEQAAWGEALFYCEQVVYQIVRPRDLERLAKELR